MRVLIIGRRKHLISVEASLYRALHRMGHQVWLIDDRKLRQRVGTRIGSWWILSRIQRLRPDRVLVFKPHDVTVEIMNKIAMTVPTNMWYRDLPVDEELVRRAMFLDTVFLTAGGQAPEWKRRGVKRASWLPDGADRDLHYVAEFDPRFECDVAFVGRGIWQPGNDYSRAEFLVRLSKRFHVRVWGHNWERWAKELNWDGTSVYGEDFARLCATAKIVVDVKPSVWIESDGAYLSNRLVRQLACGGFSLTRGSAEEKRMFREGQHCCWYVSEEEAFDKIEYYLAHPQERRQIARAGAALVHEHHMVENRIDNLLTSTPFQIPNDAQQTVLPNK